jgi:predicted amidohydrolase YtcJ
MSATLFRNARIMTMDGSPSTAGALLVRDGRIAAIGDARAADEDAAVVDCGGGLLLPGFIDAHCHVLAAAAALRSVDCSPRAVGSIRDIQARVREVAASAREGEWVRAAGYDESRLEDGRHPTCRDLDEAARHVPVRLMHRSGHAVVLNTRAMQLAGIAIDSEEPPGGCIDRFPETGEPTGLLLEMNDALDRVVRPLSYAELAAGVAEVAARFLEAGVTAVCDASHTNGASEWELFARLQNEGRLPLRVSLMEGQAHVGELPGAPLDRLSRGHVKIMVSEVGGEPWPDEGELRRIVRDVHAAGRDVAIHAVEERAVAAGIDAIEAALEIRPRQDHRHRIEHAALLPAGAAARMARAGITVVTQPGFLYEHGDRYLRDVPPEKHPGLYPIGDLMRAGVHVAASSDAPVGSIDVLGAMRSAVSRRTESGAAVALEQAVGFDMAAAMWTSEAARAAGMPERGVLGVGAPADLVLVSGDLERVEATYAAGEPVYRRA